MTRQCTGRSARRRAALALLLAAGAPGALPSAAAEWRQYEDPETAGWSPQGLAAARATAEEVGSAAVMVVEDGVVVAAWGQVERPFPVYSMRKGLYNALIGMLVGKGVIELDATLGELGLDEAEPLTSVERSATVEHLLTARSGVYRVSAYEPESMRRGRPERGSHRPGEHWFYNNWDFNVLAHLVEETAGRDLAPLFREGIAGPLGMEDFSLDDVFSFHEPSRSRYPAVVFRMSARDLARFGELYRRRGVWEGERLLAEDWIEVSWTPRTTFAEGSPFGAGNGFGYLWWIYPARRDGGTPFARHDVYLTRGSGGQVLAVLPALDLVIVHLTAAEDGGFEDAVRVIDAVVAARSAPAADGEERVTVALSPRALPDPPPERERRAVVPWSREWIEALTGEYTLGPRISFLVHEVEGRLFALPRGAPLAEVELFADATGTIFNPAVDLALQVVRDEHGRVVALEGILDGRPARIERTPSGPDPEHPSSSGPRGEASAHHVEPAELLGVREQLELFECAAVATRGSLSPPSSARRAAGRW